MFDVGDVQDKRYRPMVFEVEIPMAEEQEFLGGQIAK